MLQGCESSDFNLISDFFALHKTPFYRLLMQFECIDKHISSDISDYVRLFLTDALTPLMLHVIQTFSASSFASTILLE